MINYQFLGCVTGSPNAPNLLKFYGLVLYELYHFSQVLILIKFWETRGFSPLSAQNLRKMVLLLLLIILFFLAMAFHNL